jgi:hypothetical protein
MKPLSSYRIADGFARFVTNEKELVRLRKRFEKYTGPVPKSAGITVR